MTTYYLVNTVIIGTSVVRGGSSVDSTVDDVAGIRAAGGMLIASTDAVIAAAAAKAQAAMARGANEAEVNAIMFAGMGSSLQSADASIASRLSGTDESAITSLTARTSTNDSADTSLASRVSTEESGRASADTSLTSRFSAADSVLTSGVASLGTRISIEESLY